MRNDYTDYLMHSHKYDAKKWIKGKWRYFYDEKLGGKEKRQYEKDRTAFENARNDLNVKQKTVRKSKNPSDAYSKENLAYRNSAGKYLKTYHDVSESKAEYENTSLGKLDKAKSKAKAKYDTKNIGHFGLGSSCYHQVKKTRTKTLVSAASTIDQSVSYSYY